MHRPILPMSMRVKNGRVLARGLWQIQPARDIDLRPGLEVNTAKQVVLPIQGAPIVHVQWQALGQRVQTDVPQRLPADDFTTLLPRVQGLELKVMRGGQALV